MSKNKELKRQQREVNKSIQKLNNNLLKDDLWRGRFYVKQIKRIDRHEDIDCWYESYYTLRFYDLKTGLTRDYWYTYWDLNSGYDLFFDMNDFIVKVCDVWRKETTKTIKNDKTMYRNK